MATTQYWLMKSEPTVYSIHDLERDGHTHWEGVRNYQARNFMRDQMKTGDRVLFYHSNAHPPGIAGLAEVCKKGYPDFVARDRKSRYFDSKSTEEKPIWYMVDIKHVSTFSEIISLDQIKQNPALDGIMVAKRGMRLSIQPVESAHFAHIEKMGTKT